MVKSIFFCLLLFFFVEKGFGVEVNTYEEAIALSKETNKEVFVYFVAEWCSYCKKMEDVFKDERVSRKLDNYICVKINVDKNKDLAKKHVVKGIPDYMVIDKEEKTLKRHFGYKSKEEFLEWLK